MKGEAGMNRLWVRLALSFALVAAISVALIAFVANNQIEAAFYRYVNQNQIVESGLATAAGRVLRGERQLGRHRVRGRHLRPQGQGPGAGSGAGRGMRAGRHAIVVADAGRARRVRMPQERDQARDESTGAQLTDAERAGAVRLERDGATIGYALAISGARSEAPRRRSSSSTRSTSRWRRPR